MTGLRLLVLGPPRLERDGRPVELNLRRALALLVYLAVTGRPQGRDTLAGLLWPEADDREARARLRRTLHLVAEALGAGVVLVDGDRLCLSAEADVRVDARTFERRAAAGLGSGSGVPDPEQVEHLRRAAALYADDFLAGFTLPDSVAWDEWQFLERERLRETFARVLDRLVEAQRALGAPEAAIDYARRRLALDPLHEPAHRALMELYALAGQQAAACASIASAPGSLRPSWGWHRRLQPLSSTRPSGRDACRPRPPGPPTPRRSRPPPRFRPRHDPTCTTAYRRSPLA